ncbi:hypothetical protein BDN70DRAFT_817740 [Pholiota conissans]|uniref:Uncharacterized protein n=1 Tax=Pholiota conissans TaxID=109636 RepID=A0A9P5YR07_9AGAR|nr:hypothetical protein BDN70DRAFT_817740 [Pholiota conissans]
MQEIYLRKRFFSCCCYWLTGVPCDQFGIPLPDGSAPPQRTTADPTDWSPFTTRIAFETADFLFRRAQMPQAQIDELMSFWAATLSKHNDSPPFSNHSDMLSTIDSSTLGNVPWQSFTVSYSGKKPDRDVPEWMNTEFVVWYRDPYEVIKQMLDNPDFDGEFDYAAYREYGDDNQRKYKDFMSGDWAWRQSDIIAKDPTTKGSVFVPAIFGSDKTTVSVATGQNEYYPLYLSIGNIHNATRRAHCNSVLFHSSLSYILQSLRPGMTEPEIMRFPDGHYRRTIFGLGPYIADYPEQALLACIVNNWCPKCTAPADDLDSGALPRTREFSDVQAENLELGEAWDAYGLVADIVVCTIFQL